jgi:hypothetical protein
MRSGRWLKGTQMWGSSSRIALLREGKPGLLGSFATLVCEGDREGGR